MVFWIGFGIAVAALVATLVLVPTLRDRGRSPETAEDRAAASTRVRRLRRTKWDAAMDPSLGVWTGKVGRREGPQSGGWY